MTYPRIPSNAFSLTNPHHLVGMAIISCNNEILTMHGNEDPFAQMIVPVYSRVDSRNQIIPTLSKKTGIDSKLFSDPKVYARIGGRNNTQEITLFRITYQAQPVINQTAGDLAWTSKHGASDLWMTTPADILALILNTYK